MKAQRSGFTLFELLIVVAIIGVIAAVAIPSVVRARVSANGKMREQIAAVRNVDSIAAQLEEGHVVWSVPKAFPLRGIEVTMVRLVPEAVLPKSGPPLFLVAARLTSSEGLKVQALSEQTQPLGPTEPKWEWLIEPRQRGVQQLALSLDLCARPSLCRSVVAHRQVTVVATLWQRLEAVGADNWKLVLGAVGGWLLGLARTYRESRRKKGETAQQVPPLPSKQ